MRKISPYITEKTISLVKSNKFTLIVDYDATKKEVESLIKKFYRVAPLEIRILKTKYLQSTRQRKNCLLRGKKKVIVKLPQGKVIAGFDFGTKEDKKKQTKEKSALKKEKDGQES